MSIPVVFACGSEVIGMPDGRRVHVSKGTHWPANDAVVKMRPNLFSADPRWGMLYTSEPEGYDAPIGESEMEAATANPGEKRSVRRAER